MIANSFYALMFLICHTFQSCRTINNQMTSGLRLQHSYTYASRQLDKWHWIDFASKLFTTQIMMKICDNLVTVSFCLAPPLHCQDMRLGKRVDFSCLNFIFYFILEKEHCFTFSHELSAKHNIWRVRLEKKKKRKKTTTLLHPCPLHACSSGNL